METAIGEGKDEEGSGPSLRCWEILGVICFDFCDFSGCGGSGDEVMGRVEGCCEALKARNLLELSIKILISLATTRSSEEGAILTQVPEWHDRLTCYLFLLRQWLGWHEDKGEDEE